MIAKGSLIFYPMKYSTETKKKQLSYARFSFLLLCLLIFQTREVYDFALKISVAYPRGCIQTESNLQNERARVKMKFC